MASLSLSLADVDAEVVEARTSACADPFLIPQFENGSERKGREGQWLMY
jgi:hypothetical protein